MAGRPRPARGLARRQRSGALVGSASEDFVALVERVVSGLRPGAIVTYGEVAAEIGRPGAARAVGGVMARSDGLPWWRVVAANGRLVPGHEREQTRRLRAEGVGVANGHVLQLPRGHTAAT